MTGRVDALPYEVSTPVYEGPFDLLLHLITKEQVDIYEVSLSRIVDAYLAEIERIQELDLEVATEFLLIAATLVELKLRRLLPGRDDVDIDDELGLLSERDLLIAKLLEYQTFREAAEHLRRCEAQASRSWPRTAGPGDEFVDLTPDLLAGVGPIDVRNAYVAVIRRALAPPPTPPKVSLAHVHAPRITVAEVVEELASYLPRAGRTTLRILTTDRPLGDVVVFFLGLLELYKQGWVELDQPVPMGELAVHWQPDGPEAGHAGFATEPVEGAAGGSGRTGIGGRNLDVASVMAAVSVDTTPSDSGQEHDARDEEGSLLLRDSSDDADESDADAFDVELDRVLAVAHENRRRSRPTLIHEGEEVEDLDDV